MSILFLKRGLAGFCLVAMPLMVVAQSTNRITSPGFFYSVNGSGENPSIDIQQGTTNTLIINTDSFHPVDITTNAPPDISGLYVGAHPQNINNGSIVIIIPASDPTSRLYYICSFHRFAGQINIIPATPAAPPRNTIISVTVGTNVVMKSTGTNTSWVLIPEFSSNLTAGIWTTVPNYTNTFSNGTNTTVFNRLDPICGPNVFLRLRQQQN